MASMWRPWEGAMEMELGENEDNLAGENNCENGSEKVEGEEMEGNDSSQDFYKVGADMYFDNEPIDSDKVVDSSMEEEGEGNLSKVVIDSSLSGAEWCRILEGNVSADESSEDEIRTIPETVFSNQKEIKVESNKDKSRRVKIEEEIVIIDDDSDTNSTVPGKKS